MKKYELTQNIKKIGNITLHQIKALQDFGIVKAGTLGGYIENEDNLSQKGTAWVYGNAMVHDNAIVHGNALVYGGAWIYDDAEVGGNAKVFGDARVSGNAKVFDDAWVCGNARVSGNAWVGGNATVFGNAEVYRDAIVCGDAEVSGNARVYGNARVSKINHLFTIGPIDSWNRTITFYRNIENKISVVSDCFIGSIDEFVEDVKEDTHGDNEHAKVYELAVELAKLQIGLS